MYSWLATPTQTRSTLELHGLATKHRMGQNFLVNDTIIGKILDASRLSEADSVLEVGPGIGTLTCAMLPRAAAVVAIEADRQLEAVLEETLAQDSDRFALIMADALRVDEKDIVEALETVAHRPHPEFPTAFVANLPYQVAATLILKFFRQMPSIRRAVVMVQSEVADRISATPGTKAYGAYTAKLNLIGQVTDRFQVGPGNFMPPPHVESAVVRIDRNLYARPDGRTLTQEECNGCCQVIDAAFAQRRKTIRNSMASQGFDKQQLDLAFQAAGIDSGCRAETLTVGQFVALADALSL